MKRFLSAALALVMLISAVPVCADADNHFQPSSEIVQFIKEHEGFSPTAYWDYAQYTIGYGTRATEEEYYSGYVISEEEADFRLRQELAKDSKKILGFADNYGITLTQYRYDALLSFCYNVGTSWMDSTDNRITKYLINGIDNYPQLEIADSMIVWSHAGGEFLDGLARRRIREAKVLLYGDYSGTGPIDFCYLNVNPNGGRSDNGNNVFAFYKGRPYGTLPGYSLNGAAGGVMVKQSDGRVLSPTDIVTSNQTVTIVWQGDPPDPDTGITDPEPATDLPFTDIFYEDWYYQSVHDAYIGGIISGYPDATFRPKETISRAEFVTMLANLAEADCTGTSTDMFSDVAPGAWYADTVGWAYRLGIVSGFDDNTFKPNDAITRQDMAAILGRYLTCVGCSLPGVKEAQTFGDSTDISDYAYGDICAMQRAGIINGYIENGVCLFKPKANAIRAEVCVVLCNMAEAMNIALRPQNDEEPAETEEVPETEEPAETEEVPEAEEVPETEEVPEIEEVAETEETVETEEAPEIGKIPDEPETDVTVP